MSLDGLDVVDMGKILIRGLVSRVRTDGFARSGFTPDTVKVAGVDMSILRRVTELKEARYSIGIGGVLIDFAGRTLRDGDGDLQVVSNTPDAVILKTVKSKIPHSRCQPLCRVCQDRSPVEHGQ